MVKLKNNLINKRRFSMMALFCSTQERQKQKADFDSIQDSKGIMIFKSELDYISRCILDRKNIETGGQLFGYWSEDGRPVVLYAIGPGPKANHQQTFFNQDVDYLLAVGRKLKDDYGLHHIGEWHSHHQLGLARPSSHDVNTMVSTIREKGLGKFLLCIGNCTTKASSLKGFVCDGSSCSQKEWDVIYSESPVRKDADVRFRDILRHPRTPKANHTDASLNDAHSQIPNYAEGYWLKQPGNGAVLNDIMEYLKRKHLHSEVKAQMNPSGEVVLSVWDYPDEVKILFPQGFPVKGPKMLRTRYGALKNCSSDSDWQFMKGNIVGSFIRFYETV